MNKFSKIFLLLLAFIFLTTYNTSENEFFSHKKKNYFQIKEIKIVNNDRISKEEIKAKLQKIYGKNIFFINKRNLIESFDQVFFLEKIEVKKKYPNTLIIKVYETEPVAIIFRDQKKYLLDNLSNLIPAEENYNFSNLPILFGEGAEKNFINFFNELKKANFPHKKIKNYYFFQIGRWDLKLLNDQLIKFPHERTQYAIKQSIELLKRQDFKNYKVIDLRLPDKIVVE